MRHDEFAVEHKSFRLQFERGTHQFGKISREILTRFRAEIDIVTMARKQTAKTVPFGLVLPLRSARNGVDGARFHRRQPLRPGGFSCGPLVYERHTSQRKRPAIRRPSGLIIVFEADQTAAVIHCCSFCFGAAPTWREAISPPLKIIRVGIDITPYFEAVFGLSSTFSFTILTLSPIVPEISSGAGAAVVGGASLVLKSTMRTSDGVTTRRSIWPETRACGRPGCVGLPAMATSARLPGANTGPKRASAISASA